LALPADDRVLFTAARTRLRSLPSHVRLDLSVGTESDNTEDTAAFAKLLDELKPAGLDYRFTLYPGENHNSVWVKYQVLLSRGDCPFVHIGCTFRLEPDKQTRSAGLTAHKSEGS
jgi:hypothetical protein